MRTAHVIVGILSSLSMSVPGINAAGNPIAPASVAIVCSMEGRAVLQGASGKSKPLALFDWIPEKAQIRTDARSKVNVVFSGGERFSIGEKSRATVEHSKLRPKAGDVQKLASVPMIPAMHQALMHGGGKPGATRVRNLPPPHNWFSDPRPHEGEVILANEARLSFVPKEPGGRMRVEIRDELGSVFFSLETSESSVPLAAELLEPGRPYTWTLARLDGPRPAPPYQIGFKTVGSEHARVRIELKTLVERTGDPDMVALLKAMDRWLGLSQ